MLQKVLLFIKYNNAFTLIVGLCFFSFGVTFAASPTVRDSVYSSEETLISIDNKLILQADLDSFDFNLKIDSITEDEKNYYVVYSYKTITLDNGFWQERNTEKTLTVNKEALAGKDLGLYVAKELADNVNYELSYLKRVQILEKEKGESRKIITTEYSGLIGKLLDPKDEVIEGYDPVIPVPIPSVAVVEEADLQMAAIIEALIKSKINPEKEQDDSIITPSPEPSISPNDQPQPQSQPQPEATSTPEIIPDTATTTPEVSNPEPEQTAPVPEPEPTTEVESVPPVSEPENPPAPEVPPVSEPPHEPASEPVPGS